MVEQQYRPLQQGEIRVLKLISNKNLQFELDHVNLRSKPKYSALSYTWGTSEQSHSIRVDQSLCLVTDNLYDALEQLTKRRRWKLPFISKGSLLWVDAICINQSDYAERSQQVQLMRYLYENARKVYVWLGKPENEVFNKLAVEKMQEFTTRYHTSLEEVLPYRPWWWPNKPIRPETFRYQSFADLPVRDKSVFDLPGTATHNAWLGICDIWRKPWWTRTWVYQEATMRDNFSFIYVRGIFYKSRNLKVVFLCGSSNFSWRDIDMTILAYEKLHTTPYLDTTFMDGASEPCLKLSRLLNARQAGPQHPLDLLQTFRLTDCKDPRDKAFAPLGLAQIPAGGIPIDYRLPLKDVYMSVVLFMRHMPGHGLEFLGYAAALPDGEASQERTVPSWVPDWSMKLDIHPLPKRLCGPEERAVREVVPYDRRGLAYPAPRWRTNCYNASGGAALQAIFGDSELRLRGIQVDVISDIMEFEDTKQCRDKGRQWRSEAGGQYIQTREPFADALKRVWAADVDCSAWGQARTRNKAIDYAVLQQDRHGLTAEEVERQENMKIAHQQATQSRNICRTKHDFIGLVPNSARVGDELYVLLGGQVLYTLRRISGRDHRWTYIGECYLHGLMDGEVMQWVREGRLTIQDIFLV